MVCGREQGEGLFSISVGIYSCRLCRKTLVGEPEFLATLVGEPKGDEAPSRCMFVRRGRGACASDHRVIKMCAGDREVHVYRYEASTLGGPWPPGGPPGEGGRYVSTLG